MVEFALLSLILQCQYYPDVTKVHVTHHALKFRCFNVSHFKNWLEKIELFGTTGFCSLSWMCIVFLGNAMHVKQWENND